jgi:O-antigen ligase
MSVAEPEPLQTQSTVADGWNRAAFAGLFFFTVLLYVRPNSLFPELLGTLPLAKAACAVALLAGALAFVRVRRLPAFPLEAKMVVLIALLGALLTPFAESRELSLGILMESYVKVACVFVLLINIVDTRRRLLMLLQLTVAAGAVFALKAVMDYAAGNFPIKGERIAGFPGIFYNPNSLAAMLVPTFAFAVVLAARSAGFARAAYVACSALLYLGAVATMSRGGFLALTAVVAVLTWKLAGRSRRAVVPVVGHALVALALALPSTFSNRNVTVLRPSAHTESSNQQRVKLLEHGVSLMERRPGIGIGMGNYRVHSDENKVAHNSYVEILVELGIVGLAAYLIVLLAPIPPLRRIEFEAARGRGAPWDPGDREAYCLSVGIQAALVAFMVHSLFRSAEYNWEGYLLVGYAIALRMIWASEHGAAGRAGWPTSDERRECRERREPGEPRDAVRAER